MAARLTRLKLETALVRALEVSRHEGFRGVLVVKDGIDGYRVVLCEAGIGEDTIVAEVKAFGL